MQLNMENLPQHAIQSYSESSVVIDGQSYDHTILLTATQLISLPTIKTLKDIIPYDILDALSAPPPIFLIGHHEKNTYLPAEKLFIFTREKVGVECMAFDSACRTYNILLGDAREVGILLVV